MLALLPLSAGAQQTRRVTIPQSMQVKQQRPMWAMNRNLSSQPKAMPQLRADAYTMLYGTVIFSDLWEEESEYGIYSFPVEANTFLSKLYGDYQFHINGAAVLHNGNYYLTNGQDYGEGIESVTCYVYESESWEQMDELELPANWFAADMSVNPISNQVYGICASYDGGQELAILDFNSQQRTLIGKLGQNFITLSIDASGLIYGISTEGTLYRISAEDASLVEVGSTGVTPAYMQSATFDWASGKLYWTAATSSDLGALYEVNTSSGVATQISRFSGNEEIVGLYCLNEGTPWEGPDVPVASQNVSLTYSDGQLSLTWDAPTVGLHNGELDPSALTYTITRYPENVVVAEGWTSTAFTESFTAESLQAVYYTVVAYNGELAGDPASSNYVTVGDAVSLPYIPDMTDEAANSLFTFYDGDMDGYTWSFNTSSGRALLGGAPFEFTNDYLITPRLRLDTEHVFRISFKTLCQLAGNYPYSVAAYVGQGTDEEAFQTEILNRKSIDENDEQSFESLFKVDEDGAFNIALRIYGYDIQNISLYDLRVELGPSLAAPDSVTEIKAETNGKDAVVNLSFTAPSQTIGGAPLAQIDKVIVLRDGEQIASLSATPGQQMTYTDESAVMGRNNTYRVVAVNEAGEGLPVNTTIWVGSDAPTQPINIQLKESDGKAVLTWQAPVIGQNGGYVEPSTLKYGVIRSTDYEVVATDLTALSYEETLDQTGPQQMLSYGVQAVNELGYSSIGQSNGIIVGALYELPFYEGFANGTRSNFWTAENYNENGWGASWGGYADAEDADGNGGFIAFGTSGGYEGSGSRLISGKISMKGTVNPVLEYAYCHRSEGDVRHPMKVYVIKNGSDTVLVKENEPIMFYELNLEDPFFEERVLLSDFKDAEYIQVMFDAVMDGTITYTYVDAVQVREYADYDLSAAFTATEKVAAGEEASATVIVKNIGAKDADDFTVQLYDGERLVAEQTGLSLMVDSVVNVNFAVPTNTLYDHLSLHALVAYAQDAVVENNATETVEVSIELPIYPAPEGLAASGNEDGTVTLQWQAPAYESFVMPTTDSAEDYEAFNTSASLGDWTTVDADQLPTHDDIYAESEHVEYEGAGQPSSWFVFNPIDRNYPTTSWFGDSNGWDPVSGKQFFVSISVAEGTTDDWLISPELSGEAQTITFYEHGYYSMEKFEVLTSTTDKETTSFVLLASESSSYGWTKRSYDLPEGTKYFAIRNVSDGYSYRLFVDDIQFKPASGKGVLELNGYNIYCDGSLVDSISADNVSYLDTPEEAGFHVYHVTAVYNLGESAATMAEVDVVTGISHLSAGATATSGIYSIDGRRLSAPTDGVNIIRKEDGSVQKMIRK